MKTKQLLTVVVFLFWGLSSHSQGTFNKLLFEYPNALTYDIKELKDSSLLSTGYTYDENKMDLFLLKQKKNGTVDWMKKIGSGSGGWGNSILPLDNNEFAITGTIAGDVYILKINQYGDTLWTKKYGGDKTDGGYRIIENYDHGFIIAGFTYSGTGSDGLCNILILNLNSNGDTLWTKKFASDKNTYSHDIIKTSDGGYLIAGYYENSFFDRDCYFLKINKNGDLIWSKKQGNIYYDDAYAVTETTDKGFMVAAATCLKGDGNMASYLLRLNEYGDTVWTKTYEGDLADRSTSVVKTYDSCYVFAGFTGDYPNTHFQAIKINLEGNVLWTKKIKSIENDWAESIIQTLDSSIVIVGHSLLDSNGYSHIIRLDKNGELRLNATDDTLEIFENLPKETIIGKVKGMIGNKTLGDYTNSYKLVYTDLNSAIAIQPNNGNISVSDSSLIDYETTKSFQLFVSVSDSINSDLAHILIKIKDVDENHSAIQNPKVDLFRIYPNPSTGLVQIKPILNSEKLLIDLFDINGKMIDRQIVRVKDKVLIDYSRYPKGIYCLKISTDKTEYSKTLIIN